MKEPLVPRRHTSSAFHPFLLCCVATILWVLPRVAGSTPRTTSKTQGHNNEGFSLLSRSFGVLKKHGQTNTRRPTPIATTSDAHSIRDHHREPEEFVSKPDRRGVLLQKMSLRQRTIQKAEEEDDAGLVLYSIRSFTQG